MWFTIAVVSWILFACVCYFWRKILEDVLDLPKSQFLSKVEESSNSVSLAELGLRDAVRRVAREAARLPCLAGTSTGNQLASYGRETDNTYEDLLATAILNKVIDTFQKDNHNTSANVTSPTESISSRHSSKSASQRFANERDDFVLDDFERRRLYRKGSLPSASCIQINPLHRSDYYENDECASLHSEPPVHFNTNNYYLRSKNIGARRRRYLMRNVERDAGSLSSLDDYVPRHQRDDNFSFMVKQSIDELTSSDIDESYDPQLESDEVSEINSQLPHHSKLLYKSHNVRTTSMHKIIDDNDINNSMISQDPWEENWLFQRKKIKTPIISTPVAMLVPNASTDYRALIGDRDAEDTTDLSDIGSDYDEPGKDISKADLKSVLVTSRTIIGGKNNLDLLNETSIDNLEENERVNVSIEIQTEAKDPIKKFDEKNEIKQDEMPSANKEEIKYVSEYVQTSHCIEHNVNNITEEPIKHKMENWDVFYKNEQPICRTSVNIEIESNTEENFESITTNDPNNENNSEKVTEAKNSTLLHDSQYSESDSLDSNPQKDSEYSIHYENIEKPKNDEEPVPTPRRATNNKYNYDSGIDINEPPVKCPIAEREHKKWENAVPMPNNPYTVENIEKRLAERSSSFMSLPHVTSLERRNSYRREINPNEIEDSVSVKSTDSINSHTSMSDAKKNAVWKMFEDIVRDYSTKSESDIVQETEEKLNNKSNNNSSSASLNNENVQNNNSLSCSKIVENNAYLSSLSYNFDKTQSCINLGESEKIDFKSDNNIQVNGFDRSSSTSPTYLKDAYASNPDINKRYGRDYYIREAKRASGSRKIATQTSSKEDLLTFSSQDINASNNNDLYNAKPVLTTDKDSLQSSGFNSHVEVGDLISLDDSISSFESPTSSTNDLERVYNLHTGVVLYQSANLTKNESEENCIEKSVNLLSEPAKLTNNYEPSPSPTTYKNKQNVCKEILLRNMESGNIEENLSPGVVKIVSNFELKDKISSTHALDSKIENGSEFNTKLSSKSSVKSITSSSSGINNDIEISECTSPTPSLTSSIDKNNEIAENDSEPPSPIPTVKERMKRFLSSQQLQSYDDDKFHPNHSITARSIFRRANSTSSQSQITSSDKVTTQFRTPADYGADFPRKSLKERREFFEKLTK